MTFVLTEEQNMLKDAATDFAREQLSLTHFRQLRDARANGKDLESWAAMAEMGWAGVLIPEDFGGSDFGYVGLGQVLEAQGRTLAATPLLQTALVGASALTLGGSDAQKETVLPKIAEGTIKTALAVDEKPHHAPLKTAMSAVADGGGYKLNGKKVFVATARGGIYAGSTLDHQEPYLRQVLGFVGIHDVTFIHAEGLNMGGDFSEKGLNQAIARLAQVA